MIFSESARTRSRCGSDIEVSIAQPSCISIRGQAGAPFSSSKAASCSRYNVRRQSSCRPNLIRLYAWAKRIVLAMPSRDIWFSCNRFASERTTASSLESLIGGSLSTRLSEM